MKKNLKKSQNIFHEKSSDEVRELERYIQEFSVFLPLPVCLINSNKIIVDANKSLMNMSGYKEYELIGSRIDILFKNKNNLGSFITALFKKRSLLSKEMDLINKNNKTIKVNVSASPRKNYQNSTVGYFLAFSDITELKELQNNLEEKVKKRTKKLKQTLEQVAKSKKQIEIERAKISSIIANIKSPIIVIDNDYRLMLFNPEAKQVFKISDSQIGKKITDAEDGFSFEGLKKIIKPALKVKVLEADEKNIPSLEEIIVCFDKAIIKDSSPFSLLLTRYREGELIFQAETLLVKDKQGREIGRMKICHDLTREKMIDQLKSEFISIAAHQLRTPLSAIKWSIKMVIDGDLGPISEKQKDTLLKGYESNERVINLINDMLDVSQIEEGRFGFNFNLGNIEEIISQVIESQLNAIKRKNIKLIFTKPDKIPFLSIDENKILLAFKHIMENAVRYTPENGKIIVRLEILKNHLEITFKDNGVGIPQKEQKRLFSKFFRANNVVRMQTEGSGLGLFIAKNIIEKHGGLIRIKSRESFGTQVICRIPIK